MSKVFDKIVTFEAGETERLFPFDYDSVEDIRVWAHVDGRRVLLTRETDWEVGANGQLVTGRAYIESKITVACVPCYDIQLPKFGPLPGEEIQAAFDAQVNYTAYLERLIQGMVEVPLCPSEECLFPTFTGARVDWLTADQIREKLLPAVTVPEPEPEPVHYCKTVIHLDYDSVSPACLEADSVESLWPVDLPICKPEPACIPDNSLKPQPAFICGYEKPIYDFLRGKVLIPHGEIPQSAELAA